MTDAPIDEPEFRLNEDSDDQPAVDTPATDVQEPAIDIEPQSGHHPDNDGETVEE